MLQSIVVGKTSPPTSPIGTPRPASPRIDTRHTAQAKRQKYFRRLLKVQQMDFEFAIWQMIYLMSAPQKVYRNFQYRKHTKNQWARDDPAFLVLLSICLCVSSIGFAIVLNLGFAGFVEFLLWTVFVDCIGSGLAVATLLWFVSNKYLQINNNSPHDVEWGFAFDIHLNAFFPVLIMLHVFQLILFTPILDSTSFHAVLLADTLWLIAVGYYIYVTFLGYSALPFLRRTILLLYPPALAVGVVYIILVISGTNLTQGIMHFYTHRIRHGPL